jgi:hypothetical protein
MPEDVESFIERWSRAAASERANAQQFVIELADLLGVPRPGNDHGAGYSFEFPLKIPRADGTFTQGFIDLYRRASFVLEAKQFLAPAEAPAPLQVVAEEAGVYTAKKKSGPVRGSEAWDDAMIKARGQAERYARSLPADEPSPPFLLIVDVGHSIEVLADFTQAGKAYLPFPDPRRFRIRLADLREEPARDVLRRIWLDPLSLDPARHSAEVTSTIAGYLAELAKSLEKSGHDPRLVAEFLTRCLFCMFAEDVGLLPKEGFRGLLESLRGSPAGFVPKLQTLFAEMQSGTDFSVILNRKLLRFNGGLFEEASVLPLDELQLGILIKASQQDWKNVEPAIFGTLLERALDPADRHKLGAHYTPRAYVERLVLPTVVEPLRAEWESVRAAAVLEAKGGRMKDARAEILGFHDRLCRVRVLDPACGSGNFLYVTLEHLKRLEGEVLDAAAAFGETMLLDLSTHSVDPHQFLGLELNPRAAAVAELVLWIGYLQWHFRTRGEVLPAEPVLKKFRNIECRDAVLAWDGDPVPVTDESGQPVTVWDRRSMKTDPVTGRDVPDESHRVPLLNYPNARPADWPETDFIVGNPPFLGKLKVRQDLGDGYAETLRAAYPEVPESADFVMYWWHKAALLVKEGKVRRFGLITTNSLRQTFNRRVVQQHLGDISLVFAVPDHPWVDTAEGAAVRIAMTTAIQGSQSGELQSVTDEEPREDGSCGVVFSTQTGRIAADLTAGADLTATVPLKSNEGLTSMGVMLAGRGFVLEPTEAASLVQNHPKAVGVVLRPLSNGKDLLDESRGAWVIDFTGLSVEEARIQHPELFQRVLTRVKPERDGNRDAQFRAKWWLFGRWRQELRDMTRGLPRYIAAVETAKHRMFHLLDASVLPEHSLIGFGLSDAYCFGVLSSRFHVVFALAAGGTLEDRPRYNKTRCFDPFPFPNCDEAGKARIRALAEELDAHRKRVQEQHPGLTLTGMYNVLAALRAGRTLTAKEKVIHGQGLVSVLYQLHEDLDAAVAAAYGWADLWELRAEARRGSIHDFKTGLTAQIDATPEGFGSAVTDFERELDQEILRRLVALNAERAAEEAAGTIRWLRPDYQNPTGTTTAQPALALSKDAKPKPKASKAKTPWPKTLADRVRLVDEALRQSPTPVTAETLSKHFTRAKPADITEILETLTTLGRAHRDGERFTG